MSGHSKWSTIKRQKEINDKARGKLFSKLSRGITLAARQGGTNPDTNYKLKIAIDAAKAANMPKVNIDRLLSKISDAGELVEITYEGFGPSGVQVIVEVATDNKNRSAQEVKQTFERGGGTFAGPGAVSFNFENAGYLLLEKNNNVQEQMLILIDAGAKDVEEAVDGIEVFTSPEYLVKARNIAQSNGYQIISFDLIKRPIATVKIEDDKTMNKLMELLHALDDLEDVQRIYTNVV